MTTLQHTPVGLDPEAAFDRDRFLLRQKLMAINNKYMVFDDEGRELLFVERPAHVLQGLVSMLVAVFLSLILAGLGVAAGVALGEGLFGRNHPGETVFALILGIAGLTAGIVAGVSLYPRRHVTFYLSRDKQHPVLHVAQDKKWQLITATYTVRTREGEALALLRKNYLWNFLRRRWQVLDDSGQLLAHALEDSILKSILRRVLGQYGAFILTNFIITAPSGEVIGTFNRKFTIRDKYVLDMTPDEHIILDRRIALALGVMLDTGERR
jgi:uncharacterized protein YxjI